MVDQNKRVAAFGTVAVLFHRFGVPLIGAGLVCALAINTFSDRSPASYYAFFLIAVMAGLVLLNFLIEGSSAQVDEAFVAARSASIREFASRNRRGLSMSVIVLLYWCLIPWLGFYTSTAILLMSGFLCLGIGIKQAIAVTVVILPIGYVIFTRILNIPFPEGVLL
jgi:MFS family permease